MLEEPITNVTLKTFFIRHLPNMCLRIFFALLKVQRLLTNKLYELQTCLQVSIKV